MESINYKNVLYISPSGDSDLAMYAKRHIYKLINDKVNILWKTYKIDNSIDADNKFNKLLSQYKQRLLSYSEVIIDADPQNWDHIIDQFKVKTENRIIIGRTYDNLDTVPDELVAKINNSLVNVVSVSSEYNKQTLIEFGINKPIIVDQCPEVDLWTFGVDSKTEGVSAEAYLNKSIFNQGQDVKILNLPYDKENFFFNPCIFSRNENHYLMARYAKITNNRPLEFNNTLKLYQLDSNFEIKQQIALTIRDELQNEQYEDPRVIFFKNKYYVGCANYLKDRGGHIHQKVLVFDEYFNHIDNLHINYDGNGSFITSNTNHQKNWTWFIYDDKLMLEYRMNPHVVLEIDHIKGQVVAEYKHFQDISKLWKFGECRMGSNPILRDEHYHGFFHSSLHWKGAKRRYFMGYYKFEAKPPFKITEISEKPILYGNEADERALTDNSPLVVFPCGAIQKDNQFIISFGLNDEKTGIIKI